jgi:hypothetical protein
MSMARILVRLDLRPRLLKEMTIEMTFGSFIQPLDYEGIPFRCHRCHVYGHGIVDCKLPFKGKVKGSLDVGVGTASGHVDLGSGATGGAHMVVSKIHDIGRDCGQHTTSPAGFSLGVLDLDRAKVQKSTKLTCPRSLLVSGKQQFYFSPVATSISSELLLPPGFVGLDVFPSVCFSTLFSQPHPEARFCTLSPVTVGLLRGGGESVIEQFSPF